MSNTANSCQVKSDKDKFQSYDHMCILRALALTIMLVVIYPTVSIIGKFYVVFMAIIFMITNYLLWRGHVNSRKRGRVFVWVETSLIVLLVIFKPHVIFVGLISIQIVTVCIFFRELLERNIYAFVLAATGLTYSLSSSWDYYKSGAHNTQMLIELLPYLFFYFVGSAISKLEQQKEELQGLNYKLEKYANKVKELAITEERNRLARDIHDTVAHRATGLIMQLQAAKGLLKKRPEQVEPVLENCLNVSKQMLDEMRKSVRALAPEDTKNLLSDEVLHRLVESFADQTGLKIDIEIYGKKRELSSEQQIALYRAIQEALTNAKRHGDATKVQILIKYLPDSVEIQIKDNGQGCEKVEAGFGLNGMQQRITSLGGSIHIDSSKNGFQLTVEIPLVSSNHKIINEINE